MARGVAPAVALMAVASGEAFAFPVPEALARATVELMVCRSTTPGFIALLQGVIPPMVPRSFVYSGLILGGLALAGAGTAVWLSPSMPKSL